MSIVTGQIQRAAPVPDGPHAVATPHRRGPRPRRRNRSIHLAEAVVPGAYSRWRVWFDRPLAAALLLPALPMTALLIVLVRLTSRGPGLIRQWRVGRGGTHFRLYKIRTMRQDAEACTGAVWSTADDPRVTPVGRVIRKLHLDELPQLVNVLRGDMALVGPRPERPEFVAVLQEMVPGYASRSCVLPGITGLAQMNLPPDTDLGCVCRKVVLDIDYIRRSGLWLDARILACTFSKIFGIPQRPVHRLLGVYCEVRIAGGCSAGPDGADGALLTPDNIDGALPEPPAAGLDHAGLRRRLLAHSSRAAANGDGNNGSGRKHLPAKPR